MPRFQLWLAVSTNWNSRSAALWRSKGPISMMCQPSASLLTCPHCRALFWKVPRPIFLQFRGVNCSVTRGVFSAPTWKGHLDWKSGKVAVNQRQLCRMPGSKRVTGFTLSCALTCEGGCKIWLIVTKTTVVEKNVSPLRPPKQEQQIRL